MNDELDRELSRAMKEASAKELRGWEFTPDMRQAVHQRLAEEAIPVAEERPAKSPRPALIRGFAWVAVSAAALAIAFNLRDSFGPFSATDEQKSSQTEVSAQTGRESLEPTPLPERPTAKEMVGSNPGEGPKQEGGSNPIGGSSQEVDSRATDSIPVGTPGRSDATGLTDARNAETGNQLNGNTALAQPGKTDIRMTAMVTRKDVVLHQPSAVEQANPKQDKGFGIMTVPAAPEVFDLLPPTGSAPARALSGGSLLFYDGAGNVMREEPVAGNAAESHVAVAADGRVAVSADKEVHLFTASGKAESTISLPSPVGAMVWSADGRLAVADQSGVAIYRGAKQQVRLNGEPHARLSYTADGGLAVLSESTTGRNLRIFAVDGSPLASAPVTGGGQGLAAAGGVIMAGGQAFLPDGTAAWQAPLEPVGVVSLGREGPLAAWDASHVLLLEPKAGQALLMAEYAAGQILKVVPSTDGRFLAVLGSTSGGGAVWLLDLDGKERVAVAFQSLPVDIEVANGTLLVMVDGQLKRYAIK